MRHFEAAQQAVRAFDLAGALEHLERALELAPNYARARKAIASLRQRQAALVRVKLAYETARAGGKLVAARTAVEAWSRLADPASPELQSAWTELVSSLRRAEALTAKALKLERTDPPTARNLYGQSLVIAADLPEALAGLRRTPPDPPAALEAEVLGDRIRLTWTPPPPDGLGPLSYVVLRKRSGVLRHPTDGTRIAVTAACEFDDLLVTPGDTVGYAVLSQRGEVESIAAISLGPLVFLADVKDVRVAVREHEVELSWSPPRGVGEVRVVRKADTPPAGPRDGDRIASALDQALDRDIEKDRVYYYGIYAVYKMADGRLFPSPGVMVSGRPQPPVEPLEAPRLLQEAGGRVRLNWIEPARGSVKILRTAMPLPLPAGSRLSAAEVETLHGHWLIPAAPDRADDPEPPAAGPCSYTPLTGWGDTWTVGQSVSLSRVPDPTELSATRSGIGLGSSSGLTRVTLRWRWPAEASAAIVVARQGAPPQGPSDPVASPEFVSRAEYDQQGCWSFTLTLGRPRSARSQARASARPTTEAPSSDSGPWHVRVYSLAERDGVRSISPGVEPTAATVLPGRHPEVTVSYHLKRPWLPGLPWTLTFRSEPAGSTLPSMVLVAHPRTVPLAVDDGQIIAHFPDVHDGASFPIRTRLNLARHGLRVFLDPNIEPDEVIPVRFRHPEIGSPRA
jgi:hypothetical protein